MHSKRILQVFLPKYRVVTNMIDTCLFVSRSYANMVSKNIDFRQLGPNLHKNMVKIKIRIKIRIKIKQTEVELVEN